MISPLVYARLCARDRLKLELLRRLERPLPTCQHGCCPPAVCEFTGDCPHQAVSR